MPSTSIVLTVVVSMIVAIGCSAPRDDAPDAEAGRVDTPTVHDSGTGASAAGPVAPWAPTDPLVASIRDSFVLANPRLADVTILERREFAGPGTGSLVLAHAIRADRRFSGDFTDEMFGVFRTFRNDTGVQAVVDYLPTQRWNDQTFRFEVIDHDSIVLVGTDGYGPQGSRVLRWHAPDVATYTRPEDPWLGATVKFVDTLAMALYDRPNGAKVTVELRYDDSRDYGMQVLDVQGRWFKVKVWVPELPGCANDLDQPVRTDTLWTPFEHDGRRLVRRDPGMVC